MLFDGNDPFIFKKNRKSCRRTGRWTTHNFEKIRGPDIFFSKKLSLDEITQLEIKKKIFSVFPGFPEFLIPNLDSYFSIVSSIRIYAIFGGQILFKEFSKNFQLKKYLALKAS